MLLPRLEGSLKNASKKTLKNDVKPGSSELARFGRSDLIPYS